MPLISKDNKVRQVKFHFFAGEVLSMCVCMRVKDAASEIPFTV